MQLGLCVGDGKAVLREDALLPVRPIRPSKRARHRTGKKLPAAGMRSLRCYSSGSRHACVPSRVDGVFVSCGRSSY